MSEKSQKIYQLVPKASSLQKCNGFLQLGIQGTFSKDFVLWTFSGGVVIICEVFNPFWVLSAMLLFGLFTLIIGHK